MRRRGRAGAVALVAAAAIALMAATTTAQPTEAVWEDRGGSAMNVTAIAGAPAELDQPIVATDASTTLVTGTSVWTGPAHAGQPTPTAFCFSQNLTTNSTVAAPWSVTIHTKLPPLNGATVNSIWGSSWYTVAPAPSYAETGDVIVTPNAPDQWASTTTSHPFGFCANTPEPAWQPPGPTTYALKSTRFSMNGSMPCVTTVTEGFKPYFVGFTAQFNYKTVLDAERAAGRITQAQYDDFIDNIYWQGADGQGATGSQYSVTLTGYNELKRAVRSFETVSLTACSY